MTTLNSFCEDFNLSRVQEMRERVTCISRLGQVCLFELCTSICLSPVCHIVICSFLSLQALINILKQKDVQSNPEIVIGYLRPFRIIISLLDKPEIGTQH